jgi:prepilin-type N-terminal cleavage/methylation domain-containing protein
MNKLNGFTLIEILVVVFLILLIGLMSTLTYAGVRKKASDTANIGHIESIASALQAKALKARDGKYIDETDWDTFLQKLTVPYPEKYAPSESLDAYCYWLKNDGKEFVMMANELSKGSDTDYDGSLGGTFIFKAKVGGGTCVDDCTDPVYCVRGKVGL